MVIFADLNIDGKILGAVTLSLQTLIVGLRLLARL